MSIRKGGNIPVFHLSDFFPDGGSFQVCPGDDPGFEASEKAAAAFFTASGTVTSNGRTQEKQNGGKVVEIRCGTWKGKIMKKRFQECLAEERVGRA